MEHEPGINPAYQRLSMMISQKDLKQFDELLAIDHISRNKIFAQFIKNYVNYLDRSFSEKKGHPSADRKQQLTVDVPGEIYAAFKAKIEKEGVRQNAVLTLFVQNYVDFVSKVYRNNEK